MRTFLPTHQQKYPTKYADLVAAQKGKCYVCRQSYIQVDGTIVYLDPRNWFPEQTCIICPDCYVGDWNGRYLQATATVDFGYVQHIADIFPKIDLTLLYQVMFDRGLIDENNLPTKDAYYKHLWSLIEYVPHWNIYRLSHFLLPYFTEYDRECLQPNLPEDDAVRLARAMLKKRIDKTPNSWLPPDILTCGGYHVLKQQLFKETMQAYELLRDFSPSHILKAICDEEAYYIKSLYSPDLIAYCKSAQFIEQYNKEERERNRPSKPEVTFPANQIVKRYGKKSKFTKLR